MYEISREEIIKLADEWGISYKLNGDRPGIHINDGNTRKEFTVNDLVWNETNNMNNIDEIISVTLNDFIVAKPKKIIIEETNFNFFKINGVA
ncbi:hypothetical protein [Paenibacillus bouchesdurhonensis]|uniref:hypothetical protein n=1 Tax=Paenibacillus bouchesdurhonensis TaxID=1870990 RepID=UPI000DA63DF7|nr:hypothetical protein [Paenibacillus bouchesdurhonensis]